MEGNFEAKIADLMLGGLIEGLQGRFEVWRAIMRLGGVDLKPGGLI